MTSNKLKNLLHLVGWFSWRYVFVHISSGNSYTSPHLHNAWFWTFLGNSV